jgi:hypothetical protein
MNLGELFLLLGGLTHSPRWPGLLNNLCPQTRSYGVEEGSWRAPGIAD